MDILEVESLRTRTERYTATVTSARKVETRNQFQVLLCLQMLLENARLSPVSPAPSID